MPQREPHVDVALVDRLYIRKRPIEEEPQDHLSLPISGRDRDEPIVTDERAQDPGLEGGILGSNLGRDVRARRGLFSGAHGGHRTMAR